MFEMKASRGSTGTILAALMLYDNDGLSNVACTYILPSRDDDDRLYLHEVDG